MRNSQNYEILNLTTTSQKLLDNMTPKVYTDLQCLLDNFAD